MSECHWLDVSIDTLVLDSEPLERRAAFVRQFEAELRGSLCDLAGLDSNADEASIDEGTLVVVSCRDARLQARAIAQAILRRVRS